MLFFFFFGKRVIRVKNYWIVLFFKISLSLKNIVVRVASLIFKLVINL